MAKLEISVEKMEAERVARFKTLNYSSDGYLDSRIPEHMRNTYNVIGRGVTEDASLTPAITDAQDFNLTYVSAEPGKGASLHDHPTVEVFVPMTSNWTIFWGDKGENEIQIEQFDAVSVPPGVMRGFRNEGEELGFIMAILGGSNSGYVDWADDIIDKAAATGLRLGPDGNAIEIAIEETLDGS
tara:strand:- start:376 stop:927 length:552 start_codon:yes stop_codon:yes gene_type:complete